MQFKCPRSRERKSLPYSLKWKRASFSFFPGIMTVVICNVAITISPGTNLFDTHCSITRPVQSYHFPGDVSPSAYFRSSSQSAVSLWALRRLPIEVYCIVMATAQSRFIPSFLDEILPGCGVICGGNRSFCRISWNRHVRGIGTWEKLPGRLQGIALFSERIHLMRLHRRCISRSGRTGTM